ncbi:hypothetical protein [Streptomyces sp. NPDC093225]|uniref:hypothetical protein n=1 Tax=Streptomyces sp. NPDC093225 TaxID=3366034 RepID=UPI00380C520A
MRTTNRIAGVLAGLALALGGAAFTAPTAHADLDSCISQVEREQHGEVSDAVRMACYLGLTGNQSECVSGLTAIGVTSATASSSCKVAAQ